MLCVDPFFCVDITVDGDGVNGWTAMGMQWWLKCGRGYGEPAGCEGDGV